MKALKTQHGQNIRSHSNRCQIGYGRSQVSSRLWIGNLGDWATREMLMHAFERYGDVNTLDWKRGDPYAYVR